MILCLRDILDTTQDRFADAFGISVDDYDDIVTGRKMPPDSWTLESVARMFGDLNRTLEHEFERKARRLEALRYWKKHPKLAKRRGINPDDFADTAPDTLSRREPGGC